MGLTDSEKMQLFRDGMQEIKEKYKGEIPENVKDIFFLDFYHNLIVFTDNTGITDYLPKYRIAMIRLFEKIYGFIKT